MAASAGAGADAGTSVAALAGAVAGAGETAAVSGTAAAAPPKSDPSDDPNENELGLNAKDNPLDTAPEPREKSANGSAAGAIDSGSAALLAPAEVPKLNPPGA